MKKRFVSKFLLNIFCFFFVMGISFANTDQYPKYMGEDCSAEGHGEYGLTGIPEVDEFCSHIVCEDANYCAPYHHPVYDTPTLDYRGAQIITEGVSGAILRANGGAITWGNATGMLEHNKDIRNQLKSNVKEIHISRTGYAVLKNDDTFLTWGYGGAYEEVDTEDFISNIKTELDSGIDRIFSTPTGFVALTKDDSVVTWGYGNDEAGNPSSGYKVPNLSANDVADVYMNDGGQTVYVGGVSTGKRGTPAFAAVKKDGSMVVWGDANTGGKIGSKRTGLQNVVKITSTRSAFAALRSNGSVTAWGNPYHGGNLLVLNHPYDRTSARPRSVQAELQSNVKAIYANDSAFAALKNDGSVVTWGMAYQGGDSSHISHLLADVKEIIPSYNGFAALRNDGLTVSWGEWLEPPYNSAPVHTDVKKIVGNGVGAYAALKDDGSVVTWGNVHNDVVNLQGVADIYSDYDNFLAFKKDGSLVSWGNSFNENNTYERYLQNGDFNAKDVSNPGRIATIISNTHSSGFFAIKNDGSFISWGAAAYMDHIQSHATDPLWSKILGDHYTWYFDLQPKKRGVLANKERPLSFSATPPFTHNGGTLVAKSFNHWVVFNELPATDDNGVGILWRLSVEGFESDGITPKTDVCTLWTNRPYDAEHRRVVSYFQAQPGDICRVSVVGEATAPYYAHYTNVLSVDLPIASLEQIYPEEEEENSLSFSTAPQLTHDDGTLVVKSFKEWVEFDELPATDDNGMGITWHFSVEGFESDGITPKEDVCIVWSHWPGDATHRRIVSFHRGIPGDICRVSVVGEPDDSDYDHYTELDSVDLTIAWVPYSRQE